MPLISEKLSRSLYFNSSEDCNSDSISGANANQFGANANQYGANPNQYGINANQYGAHANQYGAHANQYGANPNQYGANANKTSAYAITTMSLEKIATKKPIPIEILCQFNLVKI